MKTFSLMSPPVIRPDWLRRIRGSYHGAVIRHSSVALLGVHLRFIAPEGEFPEEGTEVVVWLGRNFLCATRADFTDPPALPISSPSPYSEPKSVANPGKIAVLST